MSEMRVEITAAAKRPGSTVEGTVRWSTDGKRPERLAIRLFWYTQGKGTEDMEIVDERCVASPSASGSERFAFTLPPFPYSYSGTLLAITWAVEATMEPKGGADRATFVMGPDGCEVSA